MYLFYTKLPRMYYVIIFCILIIYLRCSTESRAVFQIFQNILKYGFHLQSLTLSMTRLDKGIKHVPGVTIHTNKQPYKIPKFLGSETT